MTMQFSTLERIRPGVLNKEQIGHLSDLGVLQDADVSSVDPADSAIDVRLSETYWETAGTVKQVWRSGSSWRREPGNWGVESVLEACGGVRKTCPDGILLKRRSVYVFKLQEQLDLGPVPWIEATATGKSSVGRIDVLTRLLVDGHPMYDEIPPEYAGSLYLEIIPLSFDLFVLPGDSLSQVRFFCGSPGENLIRPTTGRRLLLLSKDGKEFEARRQEQGVLTLDVTPDEVVGCSAFRARKEADLPEIRWKDAKRPEGKLNPAKYFVPVHEEDGRLRLERDFFYILRSKERLRLSEDVAVTGYAYSEVLGELRIHYAGFAHPFFGANRSDSKVGTPLIFEIRAHSVDVLVRTGEAIAKVAFYRMSENASKPPEHTLYDDQELQLSGIFQKWAV